jgi:uncharacterized protein YbaR (Trm112 family)
MPVQDSSTLSSVLACPRCWRGALTLERAGWMCGACSSGFPVIGGVPWLFADPKQALAEWRGRGGLLCQQLGSEAAAMRRESTSADLAASTRRRLERVAAAHEDQVERLRALLAPIGLEQSISSEGTLRGLGTRLPTEQGLTNYYVNLHRDWSWGEEENRASLAQIAAVAEGITGLGRTLVQGAGAGRLAYDLHAAGDSELTVATDFNPLLLFVAREMFAGRMVELYEFPIAPRLVEDHAVLRRLAAPAPSRQGLELVAADALQPPFAIGAFDTVITPWFVDIIGEPLLRVAARVNLLLKPGGRWINFGSLAFSRAAFADQVSLEEAVELLPRAGFAAPQVRESRLPYMRSPASRHAREECVVTWVTRKSDSVEAPRQRVLPDWLLDAGKPVPRTPAIEMQAVSSRVHAFLLALINGERSLRDMARILVEQRLMSAQEAEPSVRLFLARLHEETETRHF